MRPQRSYGSKAPTRKQIRAQAGSLVYGCTPERFAQMTADDLVKRGLRLPEAEKMLAAAKERRG